MTTLHVIVPAGIDDPTQPSGGNVYDRRICDALATMGWQIREHAVDGSWPTPDESCRRGLAQTIADVPDGSVVLVDGLVASASADVLVPHSSRIRSVVLMHLPLGSGAGPDDGRIRDDEQDVTSSAAAVVTTSPWTRDWLVDAYDLEPATVHVVEPGVDEAIVAPGTSDGNRLLTVAALTPIKGHDVLLSALALINDREWSCLCVGSRDRDPGWFTALERQARRTGLHDRVSFVGPRSGAALSDAYNHADALVAPSRFETYGMVVTEALARGLPVIAADVGGLPVAMGAGPGGDPPGILVPPDDPEALAQALAQWLDDRTLRDALRARALDRRSGLMSWHHASDRLARVLSEVAA